MPQAGILGTLLGLPLWALPLTIGCASSSARFVTADERAELAPRRAPGVAAPRLQPLPEAEARGGSDRGLLVLAAPVADAAVRELIERYFEALLAESTSDVEALLADPAWLESSSGRQPAKAALRARFAQFDFAPLRGVSLYGPNDLEMYRAEEARRFQSERGLPADLTSPQVFVRVRLLVSHTGKTRLLPDAISFVLRPSGSGYQIARITET